MKLAMLYLYEVMGFNHFSFGIICSKRQKRAISFVPVKIVPESPMTAAFKLLENIRIILALNPACLFLGRNVL